MLDWIALATLVIIMTAWTVPSQAGPPEVPDQKLETCEIGQAEPMHRFGKLYLAGQPGEEDLPLLQAAGFRTIINLRVPDEIPWDEAAAVERAGMKYVLVPFRGPDQLTDLVFDRALKELRDSEGLLLLHCATANRVGAIWYAHRVLTDGLSPKRAEREALQVGLNTPEYLERAKQYVEGKQVENRISPSKGK